MTETRERKNLPMSPFFQDRFSESYGSESGIAINVSKGLTRVPKRVFTYGHEFQQRMKQTPKDEDTTKTPMGVERLLLRHNLLVSLPSSLFTTLQSLRVIDLSGNRLRTLPDTICTLSDLTFLALARNNLKELPTALHLCTSLQHIVLSENPFLDQIPLSIWNDTQQILVFLKQLDEEKFQSQDTVSKPITRVPNIPVDATTLTPEQLRDKIMGVIFGNAVGDAVGLATEFMRKPQALAHYGSVHPLQFSEIVQDSHRSRWVAGDWTDDTGKEILFLYTIMILFPFENLPIPYFFFAKIRSTHTIFDEKKALKNHSARQIPYDIEPLIILSFNEHFFCFLSSDQAILILEALLDGDLEINHEDFAHKLFCWVHHGFPEIGDHAGFGLGMTVGTVVYHPEFLSDSHKTAFTVNESLKPKAAANGAVMRTAVLGIPYFWDLDKVVENTVKIAQVTHFDERCVASSVAVTVAVALMLQGRFNLDDPTELESFRQVVLQHALAHIQDPAYIQEFLDHFNAPSFDALKLDEYPAIGYTLKAMGCGFVQLSSSDFEKTITELTFECGDADTNGAVCGALMGCRVGYSHIPTQWRDCMPAGKWLMERVEALLELMGL
eukprot:TRINITY_DN2302_c0_g1_i2.p1 TRINITY_DN2302_c0_g1~~TRINITY_DN2302_c0_g1_i2.p1  ORF type:complete len:610 (-),score=115.38 TRINITY_DN2302_c0_g1_i2:184-2013(-)